MRHILSRRAMSTKRPKSAEKSDNIPDFARRPLTLLPYTPEICVLGEKSRHREKNGFFEVCYDRDITFHTTVSYTTGVMNAVD